MSGLRTLPLGYFVDTSPKVQIPLATEREYLWGFLGVIKSSRPEMLEALKDISPHFVHNGLGRGAYARAMQAITFCPCPMGYVTLETNRLYEALEAGCIPIVETRPAMRYYERLFPDFVPPRVRSWSEASRLIRGLIRDPAALDAKQREISDWWQAQKLKLRAEVTRIIDDCFFSGREPSKLRRAIKPIARLPGWREVELLRHQSAASEARRAKLQFKKLIALCARG